MFFDYKHTCVYIFGVEGEKGNTKKHILNTFTFQMCLIAVFGNTYVFFTKLQGNTYVFFQIPRKTCKHICCSSCFAKKDKKHMCVYCFFVETLPTEAKRKLFFQAATVR